MDTYGSRQRCAIVYSSGALFQSAPKGDGGVQSVLIHHSVAQPPQEVVNIVDLWNGHSCMGCVKWGFRRDMDNISYCFITEGDISQSVNLLISQSVCPRLFWASRFLSEVLSNREWKTVISHQTNSQINLWTGTSRLKVKRAKITDTRACHRYDWSLNQGCQNGDGTCLGTKHDSKVLVYL